MPALILNLFLIGFKSQVNPDYIIAFHLIPVITGYTDWQEGSIANFCLA